jgi:hypothetical protein
MLMINERSNPFFIEDLFKNLKVRTKNQQTEKRKIHKHWIP